MMAHEINRRRFTALSVVAPFAAATGHGIGTTNAAEVGDNGLHVQRWFMETFLELASDKQEVEGAGKHLAVFFEQRGCPYCREMHTVNLERPEISDFIKTNFGVIQLDLFGSREVTDFDGEAMEERELARRWFVNFTPTIVFFPKGDVEQKRGPEVEVIRMPGYFKPFHFLTMFEYVHEEAFSRIDFQRYLQEKADRLRAEGKPVEVWEN